MSRGGCSTIGIKYIQGELPSVRLVCYPESHTKNSKEVRDDPEKEGQLSI